MTNMFCWVCITGYVSGGRIWASGVCLFCSIGARRLPEVLWPFRKGLFIDCLKAKRAAMRAPPGRDWRGRKWSSAGVGAGWLMARCRAVAVVWLVGAADQQLRSARWSVPAIDHTPQETTRACCGRQDLALRRMHAGVGRCYGAVVTMCAV